MTSADSPDRRRRSIESKWVAKQNHSTQAAVPPLSTSTIECTCATAAMNKVFLLTTATRCRTKRSIVISSAPLLHYNYQICTSGATGGISFNAARPIPAKPPLTISAIRMSIETQLVAKQRRGGRVLRMIGSHSNTQPGNCQCCQHPASMSSARGSARPRQAAHATGRGYVCVSSHPKSNTLYILCELTESG